MRKLLLIPLFFLGCSNKELPKNLTAISYHNEIYKAIKNNDLDKADDLFLSLELEHPSSIFIKDDLLILYYKHFENKDYLIAKAYLDQYMKQFATKKEEDFIEFQKLRLLFFSEKRAYTNQSRIDEIIKKASNFKKKYPNSNYIYEVNTILIKAKLTKQFFNDTISKLYYKINKEKAAKKFETKIPKNTIPPYIPWYRKIFYW